MTVSDEVRSVVGDGGPLAAIAIALAARLDDPDEGTPAAVAKELRATLAEFALQRPPAEDPVDDIKRKRAGRLAAPVRGPRAKGSQSA